MMFIVVVVVVVVCHTNFASYYSFLTSHTTPTVTVNSFVSLLFCCFCFAFYKGGHVVVVGLK
jgi:hypothetical protein